MAREATIYDLVLLLSTNADEDARKRILSEVESAIAADGGSVENNQEWGTRPMSYRIDHQSEAEYHLLQFSGPPSLLESLSHSLRIADEALRFRIIKVLPGTPPAPSSPPPVVATAAGASAGAGASAAASPAAASSAPAPTPAAAVPAGSSASTSDGEAEGESEGS